MSELTADKLREMLSYDADTGQFVRKVSTSSNARVGDIAGNMNGRGYLRIQIGGRSYLVHRLAWLYTHGAWPVDQLDHINGVCDDNRIANLRECTHAENQQNYAKPKNNSSGFMGVSWHKAAGKWMADIQFNGRKRYLGLFLTPESANEAYLQAKAGLHHFQPTPRT